MAKCQISLTKAKLKRATDSRSWERGQEYFRQGRVEALMTDGQTLMAKVSGQRNYRVRLWTQDNEVNAECSCPMGDAGVFCKHCVAVGLEYLERGAGNIDADGLSSGKVADVFDRVGSVMKPILNEVDYNPLASNPDNPRWRNAAQWARNTMVREGSLKADSIRGIWEISEKGRESLRH